MRLSLLSGVLKSKVKDQAKFFVWRVFWFGVLGGTVAFFTLALFTLLIYLILK